MACEHEVRDLLLASWLRSLPDCKEATAMALTKPDFQNELGEQTPFFAVRRLVIDLHLESQQYSLVCQCSDILCYTKSPVHADVRLWVSVDM